MKVHLETERFILREIRQTDAQGIFELDSDPAVHEFLGKNPIKTIEEAKQVVEYIRAQYDKNGIGRLAIIDKVTHDFIGWTGLKLEDLVRKEFTYYDLGYRLKQNYWGKGIATETAVASLKHGFETLGLKEIGAAADVDHLASNSILKKIGMKMIETFEYEGVECNWYSIKLNEWQKQVLNASE